MQRTVTFRRENSNCNLSRVALKNIELELDSIAIELDAKVFKSGLKGDSVQLKRGLSSTQLQFVA